MKIKTFLFSLFLLLTKSVFSQETIVVDANNLETESHSWAIVSVNITEDYIIVKKIVTPKTSPTWICNSKSEFIEDAETHRKFNIIKSEIGFVPEKHILWDTNPVIFEEYYPKMTNKTKSIHVSSGTTYLAKDIELDWEGFNQNLYQKDFVTPTLEAMKKEDYLTAMRLSIKQLKAANNQFGEKDENTAAALGIVGMCHANLGEFQQAIESAEKSLAIYRTYYKNVLGFEHHPDEIAILNNLGQYYAMLGNYLKAIEHAKKVSNVTKKTYGDQSLQYAHSLVNFSIYNIQLGNLNDGLTLLSEAKAICKSLMDGPNKQTDLLKSLLANFENMGDDTNALKVREQLQSYQMSLKVIYSSILNNLGVCLWKSNRKSEAIDIMKECTNLKGATLGFHHSSYAESLMNLALYEMNEFNKDVSKELEVVHKIYLSTYKGNHPSVALSLNNLAINQLQLGNQAAAIDYAKKALSIREEIFGKSHIDYIRSLMTLSITLLNTGNNAELDELVREEIQISGNYALANLRLMTASQRERYWNTIKLYSDIPVLLMCNKLNPSKDLLRENYNALLRNKGLLLTSTIEFENSLRHNKDTLISNKYQKMKNLQKKYEFYANRPIAKRPIEQMKSWKSEMISIEEQLIHESKLFSDITSKLKTTWYDVKRSLKDNEIAVEFIYSDIRIKGVIEPYYAALLLKNDWDAPKKINICSGQVMQEMVEKGPSLYSSSESNKLFTLIFEKIAPYVHEGDCIYFSPAEAIHKINLGALTDSEGNLACEKFKFRRLTSTREICFRSPNREIGSAVLFGGLNYNVISDNQNFQSNNDANRSKLSPLPGTYLEITQIKNSLEEANIKVKSYSGELGAETTFKALSGKAPSILHVATHGFYFDNDDAKSHIFYELLGNDNITTTNPLQRTGLFLSGASQAWNGKSLPYNIDDGLLLANEVSTLDLSNTDLTVLSACLSGTGEICPEGVYGLQRGFKLAGVKSIMMSLWKIDDVATSILMNAFYKELLQGNSKYEALEKAQQTLKGYKRFEDPYYWASFIILD